MSRDGSRKRCKRSRLVVWRLSFTASLFRVLWSSLLVLFVVLSGGGGSDGEEGGAGVRGEVGGDADRSELVVSLVELSSLGGLLGTGEGVVLQEAVGSTVGGGEDEGAVLDGSVSHLGVEEGSVVELALAVLGELGGQRVVLRSVVAQDTPRVVEGETIGAQAGERLGDVEVEAAVEEALGAVQELELLLANGDTVVAGGGQSRVLGLASDAGLASAAGDEADGNSTSDGTRVIGGTQSENTSGLELTAVKGVLLEAGSLGDRGNGSSGEGSREDECVDHCG